MACFLVSNAHTFKLARQPVETAQVQAASTLLGCRQRMIEFRVNKFIIYLTYYIFYELQCWGDGESAFSNSMIQNLRCGGNLVCGSIACGAVSEPLPPIISTPLKRYYKLHLPYMLYNKYLWNRILRTPSSTASIEYQSHQQKSNCSVLTLLLGFGTVSWLWPLWDTSQSAGV